jgi:hypothetical protein
MEKDVERDRERERERGRERGMISAMASLQLDVHTHTYIDIYAYTYAHICLYTCMPLSLYIYICIGLVDVVGQDGSAEGGTVDDLLVYHLIICISVSHTSYSCLHAHRWRYSFYMQRPSSTEMSVALQSPSSARCHLRGRSSRRAWRAGGRDRLWCCHYGPTCLGS